MKIDKKIIKELSDYLKEFNLTEIEITEKDTKIKVSKIMFQLVINHKSFHPHRLQQVQHLLKLKILNQELKLPHL